MVIVDWSAAGTPKTGGDSIWVCAVGRDGAEMLLENPRTRHEAKELLRRVLAEAMRRGERVLAGFDFPFGYPAGFAARLGLIDRGPASGGLAGGGLAGGGLAGTPPWRAVWDEIASLLDDDERNRNNRFAIGALLNRRVSGGRFPFWGCPVSAAGPFLGPTHHRLHAGESLAEKRLIDTWMTGAQPCWKLAYAGSVGGQALTGIPVVRALRDDAQWADRALIWPFETGFSLSNEARPDAAQPDAARIVFAEIWPSWWPIVAQPGEPKDRAQVRTVARIVAEQDRTGELARWLAGPPGLSAEQIRTVTSEEAWTLGVMAPRRRPQPEAAPAPRNTGARLPRSARDDGPALTGNGPRHCEAPAGRRFSYTYLRDPAAIYRRSFALVREAADLGRFPAALRPLAMRLAHAAGDVAILDDLAWSRGAVASGKRALAGGAPVLVDSAMVASDITQARLPCGNRVICTLRDSEVAVLAGELRTTRSAAAVELWRRDLAGAVVAIGNAPTALFHLLEILAAGAARPALVLGFPVGFVGAAEAKEALIGFGGGLRFIALRGRRGGSALAAAAVNALCAPIPR